MSESWVKNDGFWERRSPIFQEFRNAPGTHDPKTVTAYLATMRNFVAWLAAQPGGTAFHPALPTEMAVRGYTDSLQRAGRVPRTRSKALSGLRQFCQWAMDEGYLRRNPMRWTKAGAHNVLQVRTQVLNGDCYQLFCKRYPGMVEPAVPREREPAA